MLLYLTIPKVGGPTSVRAAAHHETQCHGQGNYVTRLQRQAHRLYQGACLRRLNLKISSATYHRLFALMPLCSDIKAKVNVRQWGLFETTF